MLGDCPDHCLDNGSPWLHVIRTHIQLRDISLDLATRLKFCLPASSGTTRLCALAGHAPTGASCFACAAIWFSTNLGILF